MIKLGQFNVYVSVGIPCIQDQQGQISLSLLTFLQRCWTLFLGQSWQIEDISRHIMLVNCKAIQKNTIRKKYFDSCPYIGLRNIVKRIPCWHSWYGGRGVFICKARHTRQSFRDYKKLVGRDWFERCHMGSLIANCQIRGYGWNQLSQDQNRSGHPPVLKKKILCRLWRLNSERAKAMPINEWGFWYWSDNTHWEIARRDQFWSLKVR